MDGQTVVAVVAVAASVATPLVILRVQARRERDARLYDDRRELYNQVFELLAPVTLPQEVPAMFGPEEVLKSLLRPIDKMSPELRRLVARSRLVAGDSVVRPLTELLEGVDSWIASDIDFDGEELGWVALARPALARLRALAVDAENAMRKDLGIREES